MWQNIDNWNPQVDAVLSNIIILCCIYLFFFSPSNLIVSWAPIWPTVHFLSSSCLLCLCLYCVVFSYQKWVELGAQCLAATLGRLSLCSLEKRKGVTSLLFFIRPLFYSAKVSQPCLDSVIFERELCVGWWQRARPVSPRTCVCVCLCI